MTNLPARLSVAAELANLEHIRRFVREAAESAGAPPEAAWDLVQAVDESATNVIVHGYRGASGTLEVGVAVDDGNLIVRLVDGAPPFDPTAVAAPDLELPLDRRPFGGMGVHLARELTDEVHHERRAEGGNELTLVKRIGGANHGAKQQQEAR